MNCQEFKEQLHSYFDGELDAVHTREIERHLGVCPQCAELLRAQQALRAALEPQALRFDAPDSLREKIRDGIRPKRRKTSAGPSLLRLWLSWGIPAALVVVACVFITARVLIARQEAV